MMNQIAATEQFHSGRDNSSAPRRLQKPYFEIYKKVNGQRELVKKGRGRKI